MAGMGKNVHLRVVAIKRARCDGDLIKTAIDYLADVVAAKYLKEKGVSNKRVWAVGVVVTYC